MSFKEKLVYMQKWYIINIMIEGFSLLHEDVPNHSIPLIDPSEIDFLLISYSIRPLLSAAPWSPVMDLVAAADMSPSFNNNMLWYCYPIHPQSYGCHAG